MTELRKRMIECLQLRGLAERTQEAYTRAVRQLAAHYHKSPDQITEAELRQYFLFIKNVKHYSRNTMNVAICGIRFFYQQTLNRDWNIFGIVRPAPEKKLPVILSRGEVRQILALIRLPRYQVCLTTIYSCGLRLQEGTHLQVADIDSNFRSGLKAVMQLQPLRYEYKPDNALGLNSKGEHIGFGAQALQKVIPEAVTKNDNGYLMVNNDPIIWTMLNAIKEQQKEIEQLRGQVQRLRATSRKRK